MIHNILRASAGGVLQHLKQAAGQIPSSLQHCLVLAIVSSSLLHESHAELEQVLSKLALGKSVTLLPLLNSAGSESAAVDPAVMAVEVASATGLAGIMEDLGYACTQTESAFRDVLHQYRSTLDEAVLANVLGMMARTHSNLDNRHGTQVRSALRWGRHLQNVIQSIVRKQIVNPPLHFTLRLVC